MVIGFGLVGFQLLTEKGRDIFFLQVEQVERGLKQAELDGRRKAEEVQAVKNKVPSFVCLFCHLFVC